VRGRQTNPASHARVFPADAGAFNFVAQQESRLISWGAAAAKRIKKFTWFSFGPI